MHPISVTSIHAMHVRKYACTSFPCNWLVLASPPRDQTCTSPRRRRCCFPSQIRSFEREVYVIPNSVFSKNIVLNITRKNREYRFYEYLLIRVADVQKARVRCLCS
eukprot:361250-Chlamydomonas_euryale.AAC.13